MERTYFATIYRYFYSKITDDMYMELDETQTEGLLEELLLNALPWFEFPRFDIYNYNLTEKAFLCTLSNEEMNIIATYMMLGWFDQQLASIELTRMKYSGSDFKFTSQANHIAKLKNLRQEYERIGFHLQRLYKRRKRGADGVYRSTFGQIMASSTKSGAPSLKDFGTPPKEPVLPSTKPGGSWEDMDPSNPSNPSDKPGTDEGWEDMGDISTDDNQNSSGDTEEGWENMDDILARKLFSAVRNSGGWNDM